MRVVEEAEKEKVEGRATFVRWSRRVPFPAPEGPQTTRGRKDSGEPEPRRKREVGEGRGERTERGENEDATAR